MTRTRFTLLTILGITAVLLTPSPAFAQIPLGTAQSFAVLGGSTVTNTGATSITGDLGVSPGSSVTGFPPGIVTGGSIHAADAVAAQAQSDLTTAYNTAVGTPCTVDLTGQNLGGLVLTPGVYCFTSSAALTGTLTLDFQGNPNAAFLFKIGSTLTTASASNVLLINNGGATCPPNVNWQVGSSATLGTGSTFVGNILALTSITMTTGTNLRGRALARNGAVTLDSNTVGLCPVTVTAPVPALGSLGLMILMTLLAGAGVFVMKRAV
jgi:type VI secretion system secreted protein VgrG